MRCANVVWTGLVCCITFELYLNCICPEFSLQHIALPMHWHSSCESHSTATARLMYSGSDSLECSAICSPFASCTMYKDCIYILQRTVERLKIEQKYYATPCIKILLAKAAFEAQLCFCLNLFYIYFAFLFVLFLLFVFVFLSLFVFLFYLYLYLCFYLYLYLCFSFICIGVFICIFIFWTSLVLQCFPFDLDSAQQWPNFLPYNDQKQCVHYS